MALRLNGNEAVSNGTTPVAIVPVFADPVKERAVRLITIHNNDTVAIVVTLQKDKNGTKYIMHKSASIAAGGNLELPTNADGFYVLDATDEKLELLLGAPVTTNEVDFTAHWADEEEIAGN